MYYHATCIYSFCGHSTVSPEPLRNLPPSPRRFTAPAQAASAPDQQTFKPQCFTNAADPTPFPFVTSFPSPQEFEFARELHHSVPASPISPAFSQRANQYPVSTHDTHTTPPSSNISSARSVDLSSFPSSPDTSITSIPPRQHTKSHPFRTFIIPTLCPPCRILRESNIARFEAKAIREMVEREGTENAEGQENQKQDSRLPRRQKKKMMGRKLMPLILVEEGRLKREMSGDEHEKQSQVVVDGEGRSRSESVTAESTVIANDGTQAGAEVPRSPVEIVAGIGGAVEVRTPASTPSRSLSTRTATPPSSSKWNWWNRKANHGSSNSVATISELELKSATHSARNLDTGEFIRLESRKDKMSLEILEQVGWQEVTKSIDDGIARDSVGRNAKGMQRILGWEDARGSVS